MLPPEHLRRLTGAVVPSVFPLQKVFPFCPQVSKKGRRVLERRRMPSTRVEGFVPWVAPISSLPPASEEEEEED